MNKFVLMFENYFYCFLLSVLGEVGVYNSIFECKLVLLNQFLYLQFGVGFQWVSIDDILNW